VERLARDCAGIVATLHDLGKGVETLDPPAFDFSDLKSDYCKFQTEGPQGGIVIDPSASARIVPGDQQGRLRGGLPCSPQRFPGSRGIA